MDGGFILLIVMIITFVIWSSAFVVTPQTLASREKTCPPHRWKHHEVKDQEGNTIAWKLACDVCGPLKIND